MATDLVEHSFFGSYEPHARRVSAVVDQVRAHNAKPTLRPLSVKKKGAGHTTHPVGFKDKCDRVDVQELHNVLKIDAADQLAVVEGQVTMGQLCQATLPFGLIPCVLPEYPSFTMSGLVNGHGIQSSSHKWGSFTDVLSAVEVVLGNGEVVVATETNEYSDLFIAIMGSYGTLGFVVGVVVQLMPAKPLVQTTYHWFADVDSFVESLRSKLETPDFLEGIVYGPKDYVVIESNMIDESEAGDLPMFNPGKGLDDRIGEEWYYQYVRKTARRKIVSDVIPVQEFAHRSARGAYWMLDAYIDNATLSSIGPIRSWVDKDAIAQIAKHGFRSSGLSSEESDRCLVTQDLFAWMKNLSKMIRVVQDTVSIYPLWICPLKVCGVNAHVNAPGAAATDSLGHLCDVGIYGEPKVAGFRHKRDVRFLQKQSDHPSTWGVLHMSEEEFRGKTPALSLQDAAREKYHAKGRFLGLLDKVTLEAGDDVGKPPIPAWRLLNAWKTSKRRGIVVTALLVGIPTLLVWGGVKATKGVVSRREAIAGFGRQLMDAVKSRLV